LLAGARQHSTRNADANRAAQTALLVGIESIWSVLCLNEQYWLRSSWVPSATVGENK
jgi:hypothetical protein